MAPRVPPVETTHGATRGTCGRPLFVGWDTTRIDRFRSIFDECYPLVMAYARRRTDHATADDVVAETFLVAWRRLDDLPADRPLPWLYGVARKTLANQRRARDRRARLAARLWSLDRRIGDDDAEHASLLVALATLPPGDQEVLRLAAWEQLATSEIATVLDCSANAAALRLSRARGRLRNALDRSARLPDMQRSEDER